jgi:hypothetical protein
MTLFAMLPTPLLAAAMLAFTATGIAVLPWSDATLAASVDSFAAVGDLGRAALRRLGMLTGGA